LFVLVQVAGGSKRLLRLELGYECVAYASKAFQMNINLDVAEFYLGADRAAQLSPALSRFMRKMFLWLSR